MRLLLLNINYLQYHFFIKTMQKNIMDFEHPTFQGVHYRRHLSNSNMFDCKDLIIITNIN